MTTPLNNKAQIPDLPPHWDFGGDVHPIYASWNPILFIHQLLCIISFGCASLQTVWDKIHSPDWRALRESGKDRLQHINVVASLLLATIGAFCTTEPPPSSAMLPYTKPAPYCLLLVSMALTLAGLTVGSCVVFIGHITNPAWFHQVPMGSRRRIWVTMIILSFPFFVTVTAMWTFAMALIVAAVNSPLGLVRLGWIAFWLPAFMSAIVIFWYALFSPGTFGRLVKLGR